MGFLRSVCAGFGVLICVSGLLWIGQGLNIIRWPRESFMIGEPQWSVYGTLTALAGAAIVWWCTKKK